MQKKESLWVSKFGGTSLANVEQIRKVCSIVRDEPKRRVIVVSAPGKEHGDDEKITDLLYACHRLSAQGRSFDEPFGIIRKRFLSIAKELSIGSTIEQQLEEVYTRIPHEKLPDYAASRGEYLMASMAAELLHGVFIDAEGMVMLTDRGNVDESSYSLVEAKLNDPDTRYVIPGFYGTDSQGTIRTFSRGGSDITGAIAARALGADLYENWTDVPGICMADPRIVEDAMVLREITYREVRELASIGANVFHEEAIFPVRKAGIPIVVKNTNSPHDAGTMILSQRSIDDVPIVGVSGKLPYRRIIVEKFMLNSFPEFPSKINALLDRLSLKADVQIRGFDSVTLYINVQQQEGLAEDFVALVREELDVDACEVSQPLALIGVVGEGVAVRHDLLETILQRLKEERIPIVSVTSGNSPLSLLVTVDAVHHRQALASIAEAVRR